MASRLLNVYFSTCGIDLILKGKLPLQKKKKT